MSRVGTEIVLLRSPSEIDRGGFCRETCVEEDTAGHRESPPTSIREFSNQAPSRQPKASSPRQFARRPPLLEDMFEWSEVLLHPCPGSFNPWKPWRVRPQLTLLKQSRRALNSVTSSPRHRRISSNRYLTAHSAGSTNYS